MKTFTATPLFTQAPSSQASHPLAARANRLANIAPDGLGESPTWDHRTNTLYWIDIVAQTLSMAQLGSARHRPNPNGGASTTDAAAWLPSVLPKVTRFVLPFDMIGFVVPTERTHIVALGSNHGVFLFDTRVGKAVMRGVHPEKGMARNRFNDGKVGPDGRLYAGTMQMKITATDKRDAGSGRFYRVGEFHAKAVAVVDAVGATTVSNGLGWSPDGAHFFHADTPTKTVSKYDFDAEQGGITNKRVLRNLGELPDGLCVDSLGRLWVAILQKAEVHCIDGESGETVAVVRVPGVKLVTSVCFGGPGLRLLFITTSAGTTPDAVAATRKEHPNGVSGQIFIADVGVAGQPMVPYKLGHPRAKL